MKFLKRCKNEMTRLYLDILAEAQFSRKKLKAPFAAGLGIGTAMHMGVMALAAPDNIAGFGETLVNVVTEVYSAAFGVVTIFAALMLVIAFVIRMQGNQQKAAQATTWITRILVCYVAINCIGLVFTVIENTTAQYRYETT